MQQPPPRPGQGRPSPLGPGVPPSVPPGSAGPQHMELLGQFENLKSEQYPPVESEDLTKKDKKKKTCKKKKKKKDESDSDSDCEDSCCCPSTQPTTQIFINQGGPQQQENTGAGEECPSCLTWEQWCQQYCKGNGSGTCKEKKCEKYPICLTWEQWCQQCCKGNGSGTFNHDVPKGSTFCSTSNDKPKKKCCRKKCCRKKCCPPMVCCPTNAPAQHFICCPPQNKCKEKKCEENGGKPKSCIEGMMPATQQFLMFLQAYGLAAALIRDRCNRPKPDYPSQNTPQHNTPCVPVINIPCPPNRPQQCECNTPQHDTPCVPVINIPCPPKRPQQCECSNPSNNAPSNNYIQCIPFQFVPSNNKSCPSEPSKNNPPDPPRPEPSR